MRVLEDDPHFNAGRGSVFTYEGRIEMDAAIMDGRDAQCRRGFRRHRDPQPDRPRPRGDGAKPARLPVAARAPIVLARAGPASRAEPAYFETAERRRQLDELRARPAAEHFDVHLKYGTVGAVALDAAGHVAAATSTGGLTGKRWGRIGDSPIIGAGAFADDRGCAVSATGAGEYFIRVGVAHEICGPHPLRSARARRPRPIR